MRALARWCFTHKFVVLGVWIAALIAVGGLNASAGSGYTDSFSLPGTESTTALNLLTDNFNAESTDTNQVVFAADNVNDPQTKAKIESTLAKIAKGPHVERVDSPFAQGAAARQVAKDGTVAFANVHMDGAQPIADVPKSAYDKLISTAEAARGDGLKVELGGSGIQQATQQPGGGPSEFIGFIAAAFVLAIAFGSLWATLLPLFTAVLALGCGLSITGLLAHVINIATFSPTLATLIGLGVGIDYSLFVVTRHRNAIKAGRDPEAACVRALNTSGRAVLFAGATVIVALLGLLVLGVSFLNGVAVASAIVVLVTMTAAVTLIPALLGMIGMRALSRRERRKLAERGPSDPKLDGFWPRWAQFVQDHRVPLAAAALVVMLALAIPALALRLGSSDAGQDPPSSTTRKAYDLLAKGFGPGFNGTFQIVARTPNGKADLPKVQKLADELSKTDGLAAVSPPVPSPNGRIALIEARPATAPQDAATSRLIDTLRHQVIPRAAGGLPVYVGGITAIFDDFAGVLTDKLPLFIFVIVALGCLLLMIAFRSVMIPLTAAAMNLLAAGAAFGVVTARVPGRVPGRAARGRDGADRGVPAGDDARDPVRPVDGLPGVPRQPHARGVDEHRGQQPLGAHRAGRDRAGDHRGGDDHDPRVRLVPARRPAGDRGVRRRPRQRGVPRRVHPAHRARAGADAHHRRPQLVAAARPRPGAAARRGRGRRDLSARPRPFSADEVRIWLWRSSSPGTSAASTRPIPHSVQIPHSRAPPAEAPRAASMRSICRSVVPGSLIGRVVGDEREVQLGVRAGPQAAEGLEVGAVVAVLGHGERDEVQRPLRRRRSRR